MEYKLWTQPTSNLPEPKWYANTNKNKPGLISQVCEQYMAGELPEEIVGNNGGFLKIHFPKREKWINGDCVNHIVWATCKGKIIDNILYPGIVFEQVEYFKHMKQLCNAEEEPCEKSIMYTMFYTIDYDSIQKNQAYISMLLNFPMTGGIGNNVSYI